MASPHLDPHTANDVFPAARGPFVVCPKTKRPLKLSGLFACQKWWRRGESNPGPKAVHYKRLRA